jgi:hypothetical protein
VERIAFHRTFITHRKQLLSVTNMLSCYVRAAIGSQTGEMNPSDTTSGDVKSPGNEGLKWVAREGGEH